MTDPATAGTRPVDQPSSDPASDPASEIDVVLVTGLSGAGRGNPPKVREDDGW